VTRYQATLTVLNMTEKHR